MDLPIAGSRIRLAEHFGTIRFVGQVDGTTGIWLGVEWDDPKRGRHDGVKDNKRYFTCRQPNAGSFIRPSAKICYGRFFLEALVSKYVETLHGRQSPETTVLGSSQGTILVEAVNLDKIRSNLANLSRLREVSLDDENVAKCDSPGSIQETCPNILGLDLSLSLIPSWDVVALIVRELPALQCLALNRNRLQPGTDLNTMRTSFLHLKELLLNGTQMTWPETQVVIDFMPNLHVVEMGYNSLTRLKTQNVIGARAPHNDALQVINLDSNFCHDWIDIWNALEQYRSLQRLILTSNRFKNILFSGGLGPKRQVRHISLSHNAISDWNSIDALSLWCPDLETLTLTGNPLFSNDLRHTRPLIIARIPSLLALDGTTISPRERNDSEMFYQSYIMRHGPKSEEGRRQAHPQWDKLCFKHGIPERNVNENPTLGDKLSHKLIALNMYERLVAAEETAQPVPLVLKVLPSMALKTLRIKLSKALKCGKATVQLWVRHTNGDLQELGFEHDQQVLDRLGIMDGSDLVFSIMKG